MQAVNKINIIIQIVKFEIVPDTELTNKVFTYERLWHSFEAHNSRWCLIPPLAICSLLSNIKQLTKDSYYSTTAFNLQSPCLE